MRDFTIRERKGWLRMAREQPEELSKMLPSIKAHSKAIKGAGFAFLRMFCSVLSVDQFRGFRDVLQRCNFFLVEF